MRSAFPNAVLSVERDGQAYLHSHAATPVSGERFGPPKSMLVLSLIDMLRAGSPSLRLSV